MLSEEPMHKAVCLIRIWGAFNCTDFSWIPISTVHANVACAAFYPSDGEFPSDTEIVLEIWDVSSKLKGNCDYHNGMWPKLQLLASCCGSSSWAESHSTLVLCRCLPPALHKVEHRQVQTEMCYSLSMQWFYRSGTGLCPGTFWSFSSAKQLCPPHGNDSGFSGFWVVLYRRLCENASPVCITTWLSFGRKKGTSTFNSEPQQTPTWDMQFLHVSI